MFTLGNRYGSKNEAIQSHRVTFSKQLYKFETANIIYLQEICSNQVNLHWYICRHFWRLMQICMFFLLEINRKSKWGRDGLLWKEASKYHHTQMLSRCGVSARHLASPYWKEKKNNLQKMSDTSYLGKRLFLFSLRRQLCGQPSDICASSLRIQTGYNQNNFSRGSHLLTS